MQSKNQPHDRFFKSLMEDVGFDRNFLRSPHVNSQVQAQIHWSMLELWDTVLMGDNDKQLYSNVVYRA